MSRRTPPARGVHLPLRPLARWSATGDEEPLETRDLRESGITVFSPSPHVVGERVSLRFEGLAEPIDCEVAAARPDRALLVLRFGLLTRGQRRWVDRIFQRRLVRTAAENGPLRRDDLVRASARPSHAILVGMVRRGGEHAKLLDDHIYLLRPIAWPEHWSSVILGRESACDVRVRRGGVSRQHASWEVDAVTGDHYLWDHESRNGTWIGGVRLRPWRPHRVTTGDRVRLGDGSFLYLGPGDAYDVLTDDTWFAHDVSGCAPGGVARETVHRAGEA